MSPALDVGTGKVASMLCLSDILIAAHDIESFADLVDAVRRRAPRERFLHMDIKPPYPDTPSNWEDVLEAAFSGPIVDGRGDEPDQVT